VVNPLQLSQKFEGMAERLAEMAHLRRLGQLFDATVLIEVDGNELYLTFEHGCVVRITQGPSKKIAWHFALRASADAVQGFWRPIPRPGYHDIFGLVKLGVGRIDGDILLLVKNLRFFKEFMALGRAEA
jgi:hypothetical protein